MGIPKLYYELRRFRPLSSSLVLARSLHSRNPNLLSSSSSNACNNYWNFGDRFQPNANSNAYWNFNSFRSLSIHSSINNPRLEDKGFDGDSTSTTESEFLNMGFNSSEITEAVASDDAWFFPVRDVISLLDGYHDLTGLPWWMIIASSTLALRMAILPVLIVQLKKLKKISELFPKLPPPFPPPLSGKSYIEHFLLFRKEKRAIGCPSYFWMLASFCVQVPCFLLWMTSIRRMSLDHHPGFDCGGTLWFQNLTELPHGFLGPIFPILIASLHFINVQISFQTSAVGKATGLFNLLAKYYKLYLDILTVPIFVIGFCVPQGSLVYWLTNSSLTLVQQLSLNHPPIREKLGLPVKNGPVESKLVGKLDTPEIRSLGTAAGNKISVQNLSPDELLGLSIQLLAKGQKDRAIPLLRLALEKDPEYVRALIVMGQTLLQNQKLEEAIEYLERAISKLFLFGHPIKDEEIDLLILASSWAGVTCIRQGRTVEGVEHLERIAQLNEPEDPKGKAHYFDGLVLLASALFNEGRKDEAAKYLRLAAAYDPANNVYLEQLEKEEDNLVSGRRDY